MTKGGRLAALNKKKGNRQHKYKGVKRVSFFDEEELVNVLHYLR